MKEKKKSRRWLLWGALAVFVLSALVVEGMLLYQVKEYRKEASTREELPTREERRKEKRKQEALAYLEERYGEEFEIDSYRGMGYAYDYVQMYAYPKAYHDEAHKFQIQGRINDEGKMEYVDSYVMVRLTDEYEAYIEPIIGKYYDEYKFYVRFDSEWLTNNLPVDIKVKDLLKLRANEDYPLPEIFMFLGPNEEHSREHLACFVQELSCTEIHCGGAVACYSDIQIFESLNDDWNNNVKEVELKDIYTYLIYDKNNYEFTDGGN
ncbi:MAG: hypothetical protein NC300_10955 [Bacteroidales bacterium]|nr:hypothetical protein [Clostridium sp.]MCM1204650.1 hypothetical protein [Bacteroidales bacterium]